jgi:hypothetical protein
LRILENLKLATQLQEKDAVIDYQAGKLLIIQDECEFRKREYDNLELRHNHMKKRKILYQLQSGNALYIISDRVNENRYKIGHTADVTNRFKGLRTGMAYLKVHMVVYTHKNRLLEDILLTEYEDNLKPNNHEFLTIPLEDLIDKVLTFFKDFPGWKHSLLAQEDMDRFNRDSEYSYFEDLMIEDNDQDAMNVIRGPVEAGAGEIKESVETKEPGEIKESIEAKWAGEIREHIEAKGTNDIKEPDETKEPEHTKTHKRCAGFTHATEESRVLPIGSFHKNATNRDGYQRLCKECILGKKCGVDRSRHKVVEIPKVDDTKEKFCLRCESVKPFSQFYNDAGTRDRLNSNCKACKWEQKKKAKEVRKSATITHKICAKCEMNRPIKEFQVYVSNADGFKTWCTFCLQK